MIQELMNLLKHDVKNINVKTLVPAYVFMSAVMIMMTIINLVTESYPTAIATGVVAVWFFVCLLLYKLKKAYIS